MWEVWSWVGVGLVVCVALYNIEIYKNIQIILHILKLTFDLLVMVFSHSYCFNRTPCSMCQDKLSKCELECANAQILIRRKVYYSNVSCRYAG